MIRGWLRSRSASIAIGLVVGAAAGLAVYQGSMLTGQGLFILCGTTAGGIAAVVIHGYTRAFQLAEVTVSVPQFSQLRFAVTEDNRHVAWRLFVETVTRVSVQPLDHGEGLIREVMDSLFAIFTRTREILAQARPSRRTGDRLTVEHLAIAMLNNELRPFLSRWHPRLRVWESGNPGSEESGWPDNRDCRADLAAMQRRLIRYAVGFGELARVANIDDVMHGNMGAGFHLDGQRHAPAGTDKPDYPPTR